MAHTCESLINRQSTPLIGRYDEIKAIKERILREDVRLLTLSGIAGVGKTSLALAVFAEIQQEFTLVAFVDLSQLTNAFQVLPAIANSFGVLESSSDLLPGRLAKAIGFQSSLLVLDNCEHLLTAMPELSVLIGSCPQLKILATSREILRLKWEWVFPVPPLQLPQPVDLSDLNTLANIPAVNLFMKRAQACGATFNLTRENAQAVVQLCIRLDGLPLAIELVAVHVSIIGLEALLENIDKKFILEVRGARDAPVNHRTLRGAIDWSFDLLEAQEKTLFSRLSVFSGGWTLQNAIEVCATDNLEVDEIYSLLSHLANASLITVDSNNGKIVRYRFLNIIREYAHEKLILSREEKSVRRYHRDCFLKWAEHNEPLSWGPGMTRWLDQVEAEFANFRAALEWSACTAGEAAAGLRLWTGISRFWDIKGYYIEGLGLAKLLLSSAPEHTLARTRTLVQASILARSLGDGKECRQLAEECVILARELNDSLAASAALAVLGSILQATGNMDRAESMFEEAVKLAYSYKDNDLRALYITLFWQGQFYALVNNADRALPILKEALSIARQQGDANFNALILIGLGRTLLGKGSFEQANIVLLEGLQVCQKLGYHELTAYCLDFLGAAAWAKEEKQHAVRLLGTAAAIRNRIGIITWIKDPTYARIASQIGNGALQEAQVYARNLAPGEAVSWALQQTRSKLVRIEGTANPDMLSLLSPRELEVAGLITRGLGNRQIAAELYVSKRTVDAHVRHILDKLELNSRTQVSSWFTRHFNSVPNS